MINVIITHYISSYDDEEEQESAGGRAGTRFASDHLKELKKGL